MTIHHDKMAYGKLVSMYEEISEEQLMKIARSAAIEDVWEVTDQEEKKEEPKVSKKQK